MRRIWRLPGIVRNLILIAFRNLVTAARKVGMVFGLGLTANDRKLLRFKQKHRGERCFIVGNGPSLRSEDLRRLHEAGAICFGVNRIYMEFSKSAWRPDYYCIEDFPVIDLHHAEINALTGMHKFMVPHPQLHEAGDVTWLERKVTYYDRPEFRFSPVPYVFCGQTIVYIALQLAVFMGFKEIVLLGVDFSWDPVPDDTPDDDGLIEVKVDAEHFTDGYFKPGERHHLVTETHLKFMHRAMQYAHVATVSKGVRIFNATRGGKLEAFPRLNFDELWQSK